MDENGQDGWFWEAYEGGSAPWVWAGPPSKGELSIRLEACGDEGGSCWILHPFDDLVAAGYRRITISFEVYRPSAFNDWLSDVGWGWTHTDGIPTHGSQVNAGLPFSARTYPLTDGFYPRDEDAWTETVIDEWGTVDLTWDFVQGLARGSYNGVLVSEKHIVGITSLEECYIYLQQDPRDVYCEDAWIDNFVITGEKGTCYPECDRDGSLDLFDFLCFVNLFNAGTDYADCDGDGTLDLFDFLCFVNAFNKGC